MLVEVLPDYEALSDRAADLVAQQLRRKPDSILGLATGSTPLGLYERLVRMHREDGLSLAKATTFNLDEYVGLPGSHPQSYRRFMEEHLFRHLDLGADRTHVPDGRADDPEAHCAWYERRIEEAGGIDLQILGIGANGHIAFNEPGSSLGSRTRVKTLTAKTVRDNARFFSDPADVPRRALTMGIGTIMEARRLLLLASGASKAEAVRDTLEGPVTAMVPATMVQMHRHAHVLIDEAAAGALAYRHHDGLVEPKDQGT